MVKPTDYKLNVNWNSWIEWLIVNLCNIDLAGEIELNQ